MSANDPIADIDRPHSKRPFREMHDTTKAAFIGLSARAKIAVLSRAILWETIHNRDRSDDAQYLYHSSEFVHRWSGFILALSYKPDELQSDPTHASLSLIDGVAIHGQHYLAKLHEWIVEARSID